MYKKCLKSKSLQLCKPIDIKYAYACCERNEFISASIKVQANEARLFEMVFFILIITSQYLPHESIVNKRPVRHFPINLMAHAQTHTHTHTQLEFHLANTPPFDAYLCICHVPEQKFVKNICSANLSQHSLRRSLSPNKFVPMPSGNPEAPLFHIAIIIIILLQRNGSFHHSIERNFLVYKRSTYMAMYIL